MGIVLIIILPFLTMYNKSNLEMTTESINFLVAACSVVRFDDDRASVNRNCRPPQHEAYARF